MTRVVTTPVQTTLMDDFVITEAVTKGDHFIATAVSDAQREPSAIVPGGVFLTRSYTRRPDGPLEQPLFDPVTALGP